MNQILSISLSKKISATGLIIEQEEPGLSDGYMSVAGVYLAVLSLLEDGYIDASECDENIGSRIFVYRYDLSIPYELKVSHGVLGTRFVENNKVFTEKIKMSFSDTARLKYPSFGIANSSWIGNIVWDEKGNQTTYPSFTSDGSTVYFDKKVYGTFAVSYHISRDIYDVVLPNRGTIENKYSSVAYALWDGGPTWLPLNPPPGAEEYDDQCTGGGGRSTVNINPPEDSPPTAPNIDAETVYDYCSGELISEKP